MLAFLVVLVLGVTIGALRGGSFRNLAQAKLRLTVFVFLAVMLQLGAQFVPSDASKVAFLLVVVSYAVLFAFAGGNFRVPGMGFIALGAVCNYVVILANRGMPISETAAARAGFTGAAADRLVLRGKHYIAAPGEAQLSYLGDVIPLWRQPSVASIGDLIIWAGMILLIQALMQDPRRGRRVGARTSEAA
jgi:hypothetical protein